MEDSTTTDSCVNIKEEIDIKEEPIDTDYYTEYDIQYSINNSPEDLKCKIEEPSNNNTSCSYIKQEYTEQTELLEAPIERTREYIKTEIQHPSISDIHNTTVNPEEAGTDGAVATCNVCDSKFTSNKQLARHIVSAHTRKKLYNCHFCDMKFPYNSGLVTHIRTHTGERPYGCCVCGMKFIRDHHLECHMRTHTGEKPYSCDICDKKFSRSHHLSNHKRTHTGEKPYVCRICRSKFSHKDHLESHIKTHTDEKPYTCDICSCQYAQKSTLTVHMRTHTGEKPYACDVCHKKFADKSSFNKHTKIHTVGYKPYAKRFYERSNLRIHEPVHIGEHNYTLQNHMKTHTGARPFACDACNLTHTRDHDYSLVNHKGTHTCEGSYEYEDQCSRRFFEKGALIVHQKTNSGHKPYACPVCDRRFIRIGYLIRHKRTHP